MRVVPTVCQFAAKEAYEKRQKAHRRRVRLSLWVRDKGLALLSSSAVVR